MAREDHPSYGDSALERFHDMPRLPRLGVLTDQVHWRRRLEHMRGIADRYDALEGVVQIDELLTGMNQMVSAEDVDEVLAIEQPEEGFGFTDRSTRRRTSYPLPMRKLDGDGHPEVA